MSTPRKLSLGVDRLRFLVDHDFQQHHTAAVTRLTALMAQRAAGTAEPLMPKAPMPPVSVRGWARRRRLQLAYIAGWRAGTLNGFLLGFLAGCSLMAGVIALAAIVSGVSPWPLVW